MDTHIRISRPVALLIGAIVTGLAIALLIVTTAPGSGDSAAAPRDPEKNYLDAIEAASPSLLTKLSGEQLVTLGRQSCDLVRAGGSFAEAESLMTSRGFTSDEASTLTYMAESEFCPSIPR